MVNKNQTNQNQNKNQTLLPDSIKTTIIDTALDSLTDIMKKSTPRNQKFKTHRYMVSYYPTKIKQQTKIKQHIIYETNNMVSFDNKKKPPAIRIIKITIAETPNTMPTLTIDIYLRETEPVKEDTELNKVTTKIILPENTYKDINFYNTNIVEFNVKQLLNKHGLNSTIRNIVLADRL